MVCCVSITSPRALGATLHLAHRVSSTTTSAVQNGSTAGSGFAGASPPPAVAAVAASLRRRRHRPDSRPCCSACPQPLPPQSPQSQRGLALLSRRSSLLRVGVVALGWSVSCPLARGGPVQRTTTTVAAAAMSTSASAAAASPSGAIVVYVTVPNAEVGESLASGLVDAKLAACINMLPGVTSMYMWKGKVEKDSELLLIIKTREELLAELTAFVRAKHPYDEPEVIGLPILGGSPSYLQWLMDNTRRTETGAGSEGGAPAADAA